MDYLILLVSVGLAILGLLFASVPRVGAMLFSLDPRGFSPEQLTRRTRRVGIVMFVFAVLLVALSIVKALLWQ